MFNSYKYWIFILFRKFAQIVCLFFVLKQLVDTMVYVQVIPKQLYWNKQNISATDRCIVSLNVNLIIIGGFELNHTTIHNSKTAILFLCAIIIIYFHRAWLLSGQIFFFSLFHSFTSNTICISCVRKCFFLNRSHFFLEWKKKSTSPILHKAHVWQYFVSNLYTKIIKTVVTIILFLLQTIWKKSIEIDAKRAAFFNWFVYMLKIVVCI